MTTQTESHTRLHGSWLLIARVTWVALAILTLTIVVIALPARYDSLMLSRVHYTTKHSLEQLGLSIGFYTAYNLALDILRVLVSTVVALFIFWRKSDDWMALFISLTLLFVGPFWISASYSLTDALIKFHPALLPVDLWDSAVEFLRALSWGYFILFFYLFPNGRLLFPWMRVLAVWILTWPFFPVMRPYAWSFIDSLTVFLILFGLGVWTQIYRYSRLSSSLERQQTKWAIFGLAIAISIPFAVYLPATLYPSLGLPSRAGLVYFLVGDTLVTLSSLLIPLTISNSILRYRLWDIDIIINRTLVYGVLTTSVVGLYVLIVGWSSIGLQTQNNLAGNVFAILVIAFLFQPLRQRLQRIADRFVPVTQSAPVLKQHKHQIAIPESQGTADTVLRGRSLPIARLAWAVVFAVLTTMYALSFLAVRDVLSTVCEEERCTLKQQIRHTAGGDKVISWSGPTTGYADRLRPDQVKALEALGLTLDQYGWLGALQMGIPALVFLLIAAGLFWRKSDNWMALFVSVMVATTPLWEMPLPFTLAVRQPAWAWVVGLATFVSMNTDLIFNLIFPTGRFVPRWTRCTLLFFLVGSVFVLFYRPFVEHPNAEEFLAVFILISSSIGIYAMFYRYFRVASPLERQQLKWIVVAFVGFFFTALLVVQPLHELLTSRAGSMDPSRALILSAILDTLSQVITFFFPVAIVIAVLRYRLWDIDIIINRTLVYGALTGIVVSAFVILVGFLSVLFQSSGNSIIAIIATGLVALLFNPLRQRLQRSVNRVMYGERDDPYVVLSRLGRRLETTLAPDAMLPIIVTTVRECLKLPYAAIYLKQDDSNKIVAESASPSLRVEGGRIRVPGMEREGLCMPLVHQGETLGYIVLGPRAPSEAFNATDLRLLEDLAPQVGVAVHAARLTADLQRSRERLVRAREEERRRLRRDLHDGLGPQLAGLALKLETLRNRLHGDPLTDSLLADLAKQTQDATADIRHLVYELRPPTLDELGLVSALRESATQYSQQGNKGVNITFDAPESLPPLPAAVEVAVYRITQEALTNVIRHAEAYNCHIYLRLDASAGLLCLEVQDDGKGLSIKRQAGVGLNSMRERAEELGGTLTVTSLATGGTLLTASLPCRVNNANIGQTS